MVKISIGLLYIGVCSILIYTLLIYPKFKPHLSFKKISYYPHIYKWYVPVPIRKWLRLFSYFQYKLDLNDRFIENRKRE